MRERGSGTIVNVSSALGKLALAGQGHECACRHALEAASEILAQEVYAFNIRVALIEARLAPAPQLMDNGRARNGLTPNPVSALYRDQVSRVFRYLQSQSETPWGSEKSCGGH
jgi:NADP-dependent 3-hydroxy acid dehydrogenase YdfG